MLAASRPISVCGREVRRTPLLIPSFSSKGFPQVGEIVQIASEYITETALISAYDLHYDHLARAPLTFPELWFLDSGGFECGTTEELSELYYSVHKPSPWCQDMLTGVLQTWSHVQPTIAVSYDNPDRRLSLDDQISEACALFEGRSFGKELLIKPETQEQQRVQADNVVAQAEKLGAFDVIGFTEKELGHSLFVRLKTIARIRRALTAADLNTPIHVFGSLDMVSTPLYFLAGADIFDGLTWLRFAYREGRAMYMRDLAALDPHNFGSRLNDIDVRPRVLWSNLEEMWQLGHSMRTFLKTRDFKSFQHHSAFLEQTVAEAEIGD